jgi:Holliday junction resolvasome RuvABC endonuclease subunit
MYILGVDPGFANLGYALYCCETDRIDLCGTLVTSKDPGLLARDDQQQRFFELYYGLTHLIDWDSIPTIRIYTEAMSRPRDASSAWKVALGWGAVLAFAASRDADVYQIGTMDVKMALARRKTASKADMIKAAKKARKEVQWPKAKARHEHMADAIGALLAGIELYGRGS